MDGTSGTTAEQPLSQRLEAIETKALALGYATKRVADYQGTWLQVVGLGWHVSLMASTHFIEAEWQSGHEAPEVMVERAAAALAAYRAVTFP